MQQTLLLLFNDAALDLVALQQVVNAAHPAQIVLVIRLVIVVEPDLQIHCDS
jgi:hypothetical protein